MLLEGNVIIINWWFNPFINAILFEVRSGQPIILELFYSDIFRYDGSNDLANGECYSPQINAWTNITPMGTKRSCLGKQYFHWHVYVQLRLK